MSQVTYIDSDEEIISVIGKLRKSTDAEIFFVVPKRAVFLQSLVNLRLLDREAKKLKKRIVLVTPDQTARSLAEKAGVPSRESLDGRKNTSEMASSDPHLPARLSEPYQRPPEEGALPGSEALSRRGSALRVESIGSPSFFNSVQRNVTAPLSLQEVSGTSPLPTSASSRPDSLSRSIPIRDRNPKRLTALNSAQGAVESERSSHVQRPPELQSHDDAEPVLQNRQEYSSGALNSRTPSGNPLEFPVPSSSVPPGVSGISTEQSKDSPLSRLYRQEKQNVDKGVLQRYDPSHENTRSQPVSGGNFLKVFLGLAAVSACAVIGVFVFIFLPKATVTVLAERESQLASADIMASAAQGSTSVQDKKIPLRLVQIDKELTFSYPGTGTISSSDKRAHGMIVISNSFGQSSQSLVATTRFESSDGKIFRLTRGVTVPGTTGSGDDVVPGTVSAEVVADSVGSEYNINPSSFTIPGFQGSQKYEKITARSQSPFLGGGEGKDALSSISADDVVRAKEESEKKLADSLRLEIEKDMQSGEKLFDEALQWEVLSSGAFPGVGAVASRFDYRIKVSARALIVSEKDIQYIVSGLFDSPDINPESLHVEYGVPRPDFASKTLAVKVHATLQKNRNFDTDSLKKKILGKTISEVREVFSEYPLIQKIEVVFWPEFMTSRIPSRPSRVDIVVQPVQ